MKIEKINISGVNIAVVHSEEIIITDTSSALDLIATINYETGCDRTVISKAAVSEDFFILSTGIAGDILQKFVTYQMKLAIYGDFSVYTSKPLRDFIYESNNGRHIFFTEDLQSATEKLATA